MKWNFCEQPSNRAQFSYRYIPLQVLVSIDFNLFQMFLFKEYFEPVRFNSDLSFFLYEFGMLRLFNPIKKELSRLSRCRLPVYDLNLEIVI